VKEYEINAQRYNIQVSVDQKGERSPGLLQAWGCGQRQRPWVWVSVWGLIWVVLASPCAQAENSDPRLLAEVNGEAITAENLGDSLVVKIAKLEERIYALKSKKLEALIANRLLAQEAAKRGLTIAALLDVEVTAKVGLITEREVDDFYEANKSRFLGDESLIRDKIRTSLQQRKLAAQRKLFVGTLRAKGQVRISLRPPPVIRLEVSTDGAPFRGMAEAPVTLVEFSDFHCPFCNRVQPTLEQLLVKYPKQVKLVFRDFPLDKLHPQARGAAEAARCAKEQGKFWEYHDLLFRNAPKASSEDLGMYAEQVGLDGEKFQVCLSDGGQQAAVQQDVVDGARLGITGTPMFFINGRPLSGAIPLDRFIHVIEEELARSSVAKAKAATKG
jgi:protein-disulfide isomerase